MISTRFEVGFLAKKQQLAWKLQLKVLYIQNGLYIFKFLTCYFGHYINFINNSVYLTGGYLSR
jgi:hypothetical protein